MTRDTLLDFFEDFSELPDTFIVHDDGYRVREVTYAQVAAAARVFARTLAGAGVQADDKVVIWSENRAEWVVALWGCLLARAVLVPVDYRASADLLARISQIVSAKIVLAGDEVVVPAGRRPARSGSSRTSSGWRTTRPQPPRSEPAHPATDGDPRHPTHRSRAPPSPRSSSPPAPRPNRRA